METTTQEVKEPIKEIAQAPETEKKREIISVQVTPEEKKTITRMAVKDCGISVSEFVRTKVFMEQKLVSQESTKENPISDEERLIYEEKISEFNAENKKLKDDIIKLKVASANPKDKPEEIIIPEVNVNELKIVLEPKSKSIIDKIKDFRDEKFKNLSDEDKKEFIPFEKYLIVLLMRGLKRSYYGGILYSNTGLTTDDVKVIAEAEKIDYDEVV